MQPAHYHLLFNHLPIIIPFVGLFVMALSFVFRSDTIVRTAYAILILGAIGTLPAFFTGETAEDAIRRLPGISKSLIHEHEEIAETFAILCYVLGGLSLFGLWANWKKMTFAGPIRLATMALCLVVLFMSYRTGYSGGEIRHPEISANAAAAPAGDGEEE